MLFGLGVSEFFTTEYAETRFAGHGRQFEKSPFGPGTDNPPTLYREEGPMEVRSVFSPIAFRVRRSRFPRIPWFDFSRPAAQARSHEGMRGWPMPIAIQNPMFECWNVRMVQCHLCHGGEADQRGQHPSGFRPPKKVHWLFRNQNQFSLEPPRPLCYTCTR